MQKEVWSQIVKNEGTKKKPDILGKLYHTWLAVKPTSVESERDF